MRVSQRFVKGLIYFPLQINILSNERIKVLIAEHEDKGFACLIYLWLQIYGNDYYRKFGPREMRIFCNDHRFSITELESILQTCFDEELFDANMYNKYQILTSESIQEIWVDVTQRRKVLDMIEEYLMLRISDIPKSRRLHLINLSGKITRHATDKDGKKIIREEKVKVPKSEKVKVKNIKQNYAESEMIGKKPYLMPEVTDDHFIDEDLIHEVLTIFGLGEMYDHTNKNLLIHFTTVLKNHNKLDQFRAQLQPYAEYCKLTHNRYRHKLDNFIGHQDQRWEDGKWKSENWQEKVDAEKAKSGYVNGNSHKNGESKAEQAITSHQNFMKQFDNDE